MGGVVPPAVDNNVVLFFLLIITALVALSAPTELLATVPAAVWVLSAAGYPPLLQLQTLRHCSHVHGQSLQHPVPGRKGPTVFFRRSFPIIRLRSAPSGARTGEVSDSAERIQKGWMMDRGVNGRKFLTRLSLSFAGIPQDDGRFTPRAPLLPRGGVREQVRSEKENEEASGHRPEQNQARGG